MLLGSEEMRTETGQIGNLQRYFIEVGKTVGAFLQKHEMFTMASNRSKSSASTSSTGIKLDRMPLFNGYIHDYPHFKTDFIKKYNLRSTNKKQQLTLRSLV